MSYDQNVAVDTTLETYFSDFRKQIVGIDQEFDTPYGRKKILYADWIASGRMYKPIEDLMMNEIYPFVGNTHTETTVTGCTMTLAYHRAKEIIKEHVNAKDSDILISTNSGMTGVINKFQRILGLKIHERFADRLKLEDHEKPIVFITNYS
jgi:selenocysteine lyase/cysteine desulfurase